MEHQTTIKLNLTSSSNTAATQEDSSSNAVVAAPNTGHSTTINQPNPSTSISSTGQMLYFTGIFLFVFIFTVILCKKLRQHKKKKIGFCIDSNKSGIFHILSCLILAPICGYYLTVLVNNQNATYADTYNLEVPTELNISGEPGSFVYGCETLKLNTTTASGYSIYASAIDTAAFAAKNQSAQIQVIPNDGGLIDNTWGLIIGSTTLTANSDYHTIPQSSNYHY